MIQFPYSHNDYIIQYIVYIVFPAESNSNSQCDLESVCSDASWVLTPAPTFQCSSGSAHHDEASHPLEDLLIEHPTMSIYRQNSTNEVESVNRDAGEIPDENSEEQNQNRELVLLQNQQRQQLAAQLQLPLGNKRKPLPRNNKSDHPPKLTRRALKRHNPMSRQNGKFQVQKCSFKAGRRRC